MTQPTPPPHQPGSQYQNHTPQQYAAVPPQGANQGPWPSQLPGGMFPGMPTTGIVRPVTITLAFWMLVLSAVLPLAGIPAALDWMHTYLRAAILESTVPSGRARAITFIEQFNATSAPLVWISALVGVAISVLIAFGIRAGMNWVRILLTVFAGFSLLGYLANAAIALTVSIPGAVMFVPPVIVYVFSILAAILYIAATVLTWLRPSSEYVAARLAATLGGGYLR